VVGFGGAESRSPSVVVLAVELPPGDGAVFGRVVGNELVLVDCDDLVVVGLVLDVAAVVVDEIGSSDSSDPHAAVPTRASPAANAVRASVRARVAGVTTVHFPAILLPNAASGRRDRVVVRHVLDHRHRRRRGPRRHPRRAAPPWAHP
jgi:hypothetical protein